MVLEAMVSWFFHANAELGEALTEHWSLTGDYSVAVDPSYDGALMATATGGEGFD